MMKKGSDTAIFVRELRQQSEQWLREGIIEPRQRDSIMALYPEIPESDNTVIPSRLISTLSILGALLLGAGIILFFSANWSAVPKWGKISLIFAGMLSSYGTGYYLYHDKGNYPKVGASLILLGSIIFGSGIFLIAQAYNVSAHSPLGILMWGVGVLPVAYAVKLKPLVALSVVTLMVWMFMEAYYSLKSPLGNYDIMPSIFLGAGVTLWGIGMMHEDFKALRRLSSPYLGAGLPLTFIAAYVFTFKDASRIGTGALNIFGIRALFIGMGCVIVLTQSLRLFSTSGTKDRERWRLHETLLMLLMLLFAAAPYIYSAVDVRSISVVLFNLIYAAAILWIIFIGYLKHMRMYINVGVVFFALDVLGRYVDIMLGLLHTSLFFLLGGALLIALGVVLEKKRRMLLATIEVYNHAD